MRQYCRALSVAAASMLMLVSTSRAQVTYTELTPSPTLTIGSAESVPVYNISSMKVDVGHWSVKPVYEIGESGLRVVGLFASDHSRVSLAGNFSAVYYERPSDDCDDWTAYSWNGTTIWGAVQTVKGMYGIPDSEDELWEIDIVPNLSPATPVLYDQGFALGDPVGDVVNALEEGARETVVNQLQSNGYPVAAVPFETGNPNAVKGWLIIAARFFDNAIGRNLQDNDLETLVANDYQPPVYTDPTCILLELCPLIWRCLNPPGCVPQTIYGEWQPYGEACNCRTEGPWAMACGLLKADARGKITVRIPLPPPRGTIVEFEAGVGVELHLCVCVWQRTCTAASMRSVTRINADCSRTTTVQCGDEMEFSRIDWQWATEADECQRAGRPANMPPNDQPCGFGGEPE